jgi:hypothetical protein
VRKNRAIDVWESVEESQDTARARGQDMSQGVHCPRELWGLLPNALTCAHELLGRKPSSLRVDQNTIVAEVLDERANALEFAVTISGAVDKIVGKRVSNDVEAGVEQQLLFQDVPHTPLRGALDVDARKKRVEDTGVAHEQDDRPRQRCICVFDLDVEL